MVNEREINTLFPGNADGKIGFNEKISFTCSRNKRRVLHFSFVTNRNGKENAIYCFANNV